MVPRGRPRVHRRCGDRERPAGLRRRGDLQDPASPQRPQAREPGRRERSAVPHGHLVHPPPRPVRAAEGQLGPIRRGGHPGPSPSRGSRSGRGSAQPSPAHDVRLRRTRTRYRGRTSGPPRLLCGRQLHRRPRRSDPAQTRGTRPRGQHSHHRHERPWRHAGGEGAVVQDVPLRAVLPGSADHQRTRRGDRPGPVCEPGQPRRLGTDPARHRSGLVQGLRLFGGLGRRGGGGRLGDR